MSIRASQIYIRNDVKHRLVTIAKANHLTADELGDRLISEGIEREYPQLKEQFERIAAIEREIVASLTIAETNLEPANTLTAAQTGRFTVE